MMPKFRDLVSIRLVLFVISTGLFVCCKNKHDTDTKKIEQFIVDYYTEMSNRNWMAYEQFFTHEAVLTTFWKEKQDSSAKLVTYTIGEFLSQTGDGPDSQPIFNEQPVSIDIKMNGNLSSVWVNYKAEFGNEQELMRWTGQDLFSLIKHDNQWKIVSLVYDSD